MVSSLDQPGRQRPALFEQGIDMLLFIRMLTLLFLAIPTLPLLGSIETTPSLRHVAERLRETKGESNATLILVDIDDTLIRNGNGGPLQASLIDMDILFQVSSWLNAGYPVGFLTFRAEGQRAETMQDLEQSGFSKALLKKLPLHMSDRQVKGAWLEKNWKTVTNHKPITTLVMIDDNESQLHSIEITNLGHVQKILFHFAKGGGISFPVVLNTQHTPLRPTDGGGTHSTFFLEQGGNQYVLKKTQQNVKNALSHLKEELLADGLYEAIGEVEPTFRLHIAPFRWYNTLNGDHELSRLSQFIEGHGLAPKPSAEERREVAAGFIVDVLLANWDLPVENDTLWKAIDGTIYRLDNAGALRYRALGITKEGQSGYNISSAISDLYTLRGLPYESLPVSKRGELLYQDLTEVDILQQIEKLIAAEDTIFQTTDQYNKWLALENYEDLREILQDRLNSLRHYYYDHIPSFVRKNESLEAEIFDPVIPEKSAAGILVWAIDPTDQQKKVLLGHRNTGHWCNFGGESEIFDLRLLQTAVRETQEESMGLFTFQAKDLVDKPSHDLPLYNGRFYRMYIAEHLFIPAEKFFKRLSKQEEASAKEYIAFKWVPLSDLLSQQEKLDLYAPFVLMLSQKPVQEAIEEILQPTTSNKKPVRHTRSGTAVGPNPPLLTPKPIRNPPAIREELIWNQIHRQYPLLSAIKNKKAPRPSSEEVARYTASEAHLLRTLHDYDPSYREKQFDDKTEDQHIHAALLTVSQGKIAALFSENTRRNPYREAIKKAIEKEKERSKDLVFYHATTGTMGFLIQIFTKFRNHLMMHEKMSSPLLRGWDFLFQELDSVEEFLMAHLKVKKSSEINMLEVDNYRNNFEKIGLSVNPFLFGNLGSYDSGSYYLFYSDTTNRPPNFEPALREYLDLLDLPAEKYLALNKKYEAIQNKNLLLQIFISPNIVDNYVYLANAGGVGIHPALRKNAPREKLLAFRKNPLSKEIENFPYSSLQARIFLHPEMMQDTSSVSIFSYSAFTPEEQTSFDLFNKELEALIETDITSFLRDPVALEPGAIHANLTPPAQKSHEIAIKRAHLVPPQISTHFKQDQELAALLEKKGTSWEDIDGYLTQNPHINLARAYPGKSILSYAEQIFSTWKPFAIFDLRIMKNMQSIEITKEDLNAIPKEKLIVIPESKHLKKLSIEGFRNDGNPIDITIQDSFPNLEEVYIKTSRIYYNNTERYNRGLVLFGLPKIKKIRLIFPDRQNTPLYIGNFISLENLEISGQIGRVDLSNSNMLTTLKITVFQEEDADPIDIKLNKIYPDLQTIELLNLNPKEPCKISTIQDFSFTDSPKLQRISVNGFRLFKEYFDGIYKSQSLENLELENSSIMERTQGRRTPIQELDLSHVEKLQRLKLTPTHPLGVILPRRLTASEAVELGNLVTKIKPPSIAPSLGIDAVPKPAESIDQ